ncbi:aldehyde dehydrogenase family protein [Sphingomonas sp. SFZ2018-12]|uniref:aldehyde dehydrogenase family protein n=1 Tax=Sphingomonas sp. SFZ2018-12 TaxID=2683197 RepID=UPI001F0F39A7|nr:aldehyde dehydrogenase family protein [Sphingomonas sp. SFZ2018-12]MCH4891717.1 aldehyde dehydrogenase family protein [Sphingomonas sp. SFZ2018-12]
MRELLHHYIDGAWVESIGGVPHHVINPATEAPCTTITLGTDADVDRAVAAARRAFSSFSQASVDERVALIERILAEYKARAADMAVAISEEMGCPIGMARTAQVGSGIGHLMAAIKAVREFEFEERIGTHAVVHEPIGVVAMITPWNWPLNQIVSKVAPALAAGCTMILKPSEESPACAAIFAEVLDKAGVPAGVFNLINGDGPGVGAALSKHPGIDMVSFTGSTRAGIMVAKNAADTVKRVHQELGGKSPNLILPSADLPRAVQGGLMSVLMNSGQSCIAPARMLVQRDQQDAAVELAAQIVGATETGDPMVEGRHIGPVVNQAQYEKIQRLIQQGIDEGARLVVGGPGRPEGRNQGFYIRPTLFADVTNEMTIAREEIFGPVVTIIPYDDVEQGIEIANDTSYGLSAVVFGEPAEARAVAGRLQAGMVYLNGGAPDPNVPFGGYKQSGNGREHGKYGLAEFMEVKSVMNAYA